MEENLKNFRLDTENTAGVLAEASGKSEEEIKKDMKSRRHLNPEQAKDYGLIDDVKTTLVEAGMEIFKINAKPPK